MRGYTGKVLFVDLTAGTWREETIPDEVYARFLSGVGLAAYLLYPRIPPQADPLGPENILGLVAGLLSGSGALFAGRWLAVGKSPLTGGWGDANCGGTFSPAIKRCGYDGIFFSGAAARPVYLYADGETVELRDAAHLWGKDTVETERALIAEARTARTPAIACIGPAGEKLSLIAGISNDGGRMAGRSGLGAVMGSKKLKAVLLAGAQPIHCADGDTVKTLSKELATLVRSVKPMPFPGSVIPLAGRLLMGSATVRRMDPLAAIGAEKKWGTIISNEMSVVTGDAPVRNWGGSRRDFPARLSRNFNPDRIIKRETRKYHCHSCPLGCGGVVKLDGPYSEGHKPEYESVTSLGALLLNSDLDAVFYLNEFLNRAGMDTISAGGAVAFAIECYENGLLTPAETDGLELTWGNAPAITRLIEKMVAREGVGDLLADGVKAAAARIGRGADAYAIHAGGQELPMHDPRYDPGVGLHYAADPTPGRHTIGSLVTYEAYQLWKKVSWAPEPPESYPVAERYVASAEQGLEMAACAMYKMVVDGAGVCLMGALLGVAHLPLFEYLNAAAGWEKTPDEYMEIGKRIQTLRQRFNIRQGLDPRALRPHPRALGAPPLTAGPLKGRSVALDALLRHYWQALGWDAESGHPLPETLAALGLDG